MPKVHLVTVAGGSTYKAFAAQMVESAREFFHPTDEVKIWVLNGLEGWPNGTLFRYHCLLDNVAAHPLDYVFMCDADMIFEARVGSEILPRRGIVATQHPGYIGMPRESLPYEERRESTAWVHPDLGTHYFAGGFVGGTADSMRWMCRMIELAIRKDIGRGIIAKWHDESHLNAYLASSPPDKILDPSMCYPDNSSYYENNVWKEKYQRKLVAIDKTVEQRGER